MGHVLFTPVVVESAGQRVLGMGLAPMAVLPDRQRQGMPDAAFMVLVLDADTMAGVAGVAKYREEFDEVA